LSEAEKGVTGQKGANARIKCHHPILVLGWLPYSVQQTVNRILLDILSTAAQMFFEFGKTGAEP
jgi:hypothetical protein